MIENSGYEEINLSSLSSSDYPELKELILYLIDYCNEKKVNISDTSESIIYSNFNYLIINNNNNIIPPKVINELNEQQ